MNPKDSGPLDLGDALRGLPRFSFTDQRAPSREVSVKSLDMAYGVRSPEDLFIEADLRFPQLAKKG